MYARNVCNITTRIRMVYVPDQINQEQWKQTKLRAPDERILDYSVFDCDYEYSFISLGSNRYKHDDKVWHYIEAVTNRLRA